MAADVPTGDGPDVAAAAFDHALRGVHLQVALRWVLVAFTALTVVAVPPARNAVTCGVIVAGYAGWALAIAVWTRRAPTSAVRVVWLTLFVDEAKERLLADLLAADEPHGTASAPSVTD